MKTIKTLPLLLCGVLPSVALAHSGHDVSSMLSGLIAGAVHPLLGVDHLLTLLLTGALTSQLRGEQRWWVPAIFVGLMALGYFSAHAGIHVVSASSVETLISVSLIVGALLLLAGQWAKRCLNDSALFSHLSAWLMTGFAAFHGVAHGLEVPAGAALSGFGVGFLFVSSSLLLVVSLTVPYFGVKRLQSA